MNYTLHQLKVFCSVADFESVTKASVFLNMTQPAVSIQLKNLQNQFNIPLTEIIGRQLFLTEFGKEVLARSKEIIGKIEDLNELANAYKGLLTGKLRISSASTGKYIIPFFLSSFVSQNPGVKLSLDVTNKQKVIEDLVKNEIDLALVSVIPEGLKINALSLMKNKLYLVGGRNLTIPNSKNPKFLETVSLIYREEGSATRKAMENFIAKNQLDIQTKMELTSNEAVKQAIVSGLGCSIMPAIGIRHELNSGELKIIPIKGLPLVTNWNLIWHQNKEFSPVTKRYIEHLTTNKEELITSFFDWYDEI
jgi:DNA-binding transcriptional LysR family regulator